MTLHWGIASAGKISHDFTSALKILPPGDHEVVSVAARDLKKAQEFASLHGIKNAYQGYESLAKDKSVDIVYLGMLNPQHYEVAMLMLKNNKHILCEKPLCMNYKEAKCLIDFARTKKLFLMEAVWSRFFPAYDALKKIIKSGELGDVLHVKADFGVKIAEVDRVNTKELGGGTVLDLGIYTIQFAQFIFETPPTNIVALAHLNGDGVDSSMACIMTYPNEKTAIISTNSKMELNNEGIVIGTKGIAKVSPLWCPTKLQLPDGTWKEFPLNSKGTYNFHNSAGLRYEAEECRRCIKKGLTESPMITQEESLTLAKIEDTIRKQIGVHYKQDD